MAATHEKDVNAEMGKSLHLLIVEDSEDDAMLLVRELRRGGYDLTFKCVCTSEAVVEALAERPWDIIVSDYAMPNFDGMDALGLVQQSGLDIPFILVSGTVGEERAVAAMKAGAADYLVKGHLARLAPAVERELREADDRRQRKQAQISLKESEALFRTLCGSSPVGVFKTDAHGRCLYTNERCQTILGLTGDKIVGDWWEAAVQAEDRTALGTAWASATQGGYRIYS